MNIYLSWRSRQRSNGNDCINWLSKPCLLNDAIVRTSSGVCERLSLHSCWYVVVYLQSSICFTAVHLSMCLIRHWCAQRFCNRYFITSFAFISLADTLSFNWFTAVLLATAIQDPQPCTVQHLLYTLILLSIIPFQADWFDLSAVLPLYTFNVFWCIPKVYVTQRMFNLWNLFWLTHAILFLPLSGGAPLSSWLTVSWRLIQPTTSRLASPPMFV